jgi:hypothetical protein
MKKLWLASLWAMIMVCLSISVTFAQSETGEVPFCGSLSESECNALDATSARMAEVTSGRSQREVKIYATSEAMDGQELSFVLSTDRTFLISPADLARMQELIAMPPDEFAADTAALTDAMLLPYMVDVDQTVALGFSPELMEHLQSNFGISIPTTIAFHTRIVDEVIYIRLADFEIFGPQPDWVPEWVGIETRVLVSDTVRNNVASGNMDPALVQSALVPPGAALEGSIVYHVPAEDLAAYADFMSLVSNGTVSHDNALVHDYRLTWDIPRYLGGSLFAQQTGAAQHPSPQSYFYGSMGSILFSSLDAGMNQGVGVSDSLVYYEETVVEWPLGIPGGPPLATRPTIGFSSTMHNSDLNSVVEVTAPDNAIVPPLNFILAIVNMLQQ